MATKILKAGIVVTWGTTSFLVEGVVVTDVSHKFSAQLEKLPDEEGATLGRVYFDQMEELTLSGMIKAAVNFPKTPGTIVTLTAPEGGVALGNFFLDDHERKLTNKSAAQLTLKLSRDLDNELPAQPAP